MRYSFKKYNSYKNPVILIQSLSPSSRLPLTHKSIRTLISGIMKGEKCAINELNINFVNNRKIKGINSRYLKHNYATDILTFPYSERKKAIEGEILISLEKVRENAAIYKTVFKTELKRVIIHGCLHLMGYDDRTKRDSELIRGKENFYLNT